METSSEHIFTISHIFDAPLESVWSAWSEAKHLRHWLGPRDATVTQARLELEPGGTFHYCLSMPDGQEMWGKWNYLKIIPEEELVAIVSFSDVDGATARHPQNETWPLEILSVTEFRQQGERTLVTIEWSPYHANKNEIETFDNSHTEMTLGWRSSFDQLDAYLT